MHTRAGRRRDRLRRAAAARLSGWTGPPRRAAVHRRAALARLLDLGAGAHAGGHRDQHRGRLDRLLPQAADLSRLNRHGHGWGARGTLGGRADWPPREPHLVTTACARRRNAVGCVLRAGRRGHRSDGRFLGGARRIPAAL